MLLRPPCTLDFLSHKRPLFPGQQSTKPNSKSRKQIPKNPDPLPKKKIRTKKPIPKIWREKTMLLFRPLCLSLMLLSWSLSKVDKSMPNKIVEKKKEEKKGPNDRVPKSANAKTRAKIKSQNCVEKGRVPIATIDHRCPRPHLQRCRVKSSESS